MGAVRRGSFTFEVLEELKKGEDQTDKEYTDDLAVLRKHWSEREQGGGQG